MESTIKESEITLHNVVASGASGEVHRATWRSPDRGVLEVAAKKIRIPGGNIKEQLDIEVDILQKVNHVNVIKYYGHIVTPTHLIIVTEFAAKGSLNKCLKQNKNLDPSLIHKWAVQAARGIQHLKEVGVLHRDIKSANMLITADDTLKICDFGISKHQDVTKQTKTENYEKGTIAYLAPEVISNGELGPKADVYALGIVLWELNTGEVPYKGMTHARVVYKVTVADERPPIPDNIPVPVPEHKLLMQECWHKNRKKRPGIDELVSRLERAAGIDDEDEGEDEADVGTGRIASTPGPSPGPALGSLRLDAEPASASMGSGVQESVLPMEVDAMRLPSNVPVQDTKPPVASYQSPGAQAPGASVQRSFDAPLHARGPVAGAPPQSARAGTASIPPDQSAEEDAWLTISDLNINSMQKRELNRRILHGATETLCNNLLPDNLLPKLKSNNVLDDGDVSDIKSHVRIDAQVDRLLEILKRKNDRAYGLFMEGLKEADRELYREVKAIESREIRDWRTSYVRRHGSSVMQSPSSYQPPRRPYEDVTQITDRDFHDVMVRLGPSESQKLYMMLGLRRVAIEKAERKANTADEELKGLEVLRLWRQTIGRAATKEKILEALRGCENYEVVAGLEAQWNM